MAVLAGYDLITCDINRVTGDKWAQDLSDWPADSCVVNFHYAIPASRDDHVWVVRTELGAEHSVCVPLQLDAVRSHLCD